VFQSAFLHLLPEVRVHFIVLQLCSWIVAGSLIKARPKSAIPAKSRMQCDQRIFKVPKGIAMFDYSEKHKVIATGGMDQIVRVWNPFVTK